MVWCFFSLLAGALQAREHVKQLHTHDHLATSGWTCWRCPLFTSHFWSTDYHHSKELGSIASTRYWCTFLVCHFCFSCLSHASAGMLQQSYAWSVVKIVWRHDVWVEIQCNRNLRPKVAVQRWASIDQCSLFYFVRRAMLSKSFRIGTEIPEVWLHSAWC